MKKKKKEIKPDDPEQFAAFVELAEDIKEEDAGKRFEEAFGKIMRAKPQKRIKERKEQKSEP